MRIRFLWSAYILVSFFVLGCEPTLPVRNVETFSGRLTTHEGTTRIESPHNYPNHADLSWTLDVPGAVAVEVTFDRFETENRYDFVNLLDENGRIIHRLTGNLTGHTFRVEGSRVVFNLRSDYSVRRWGFLVTRYRYETVEEVRHRPVCNAIGTRSEGWYWEDTDALIKYENCASMATPVCNAMGTRSEGWYSDAGLIVWDFCHQTMGIALSEEPCGVALGLTCLSNGTYNLYCANQDASGNGTCVESGSCMTDADCENPENFWTRPLCHGVTTCSEGACVVNCDNPPAGPWSWTTHLLRDYESQHPYANNTGFSWQFTRPGAQRIKLFFTRIDLESGYDYLQLAGTDPNFAPVRLTGSYSDYWSPEIRGDTVNILLTSDSSITGWGFAATMVSYYEQLPYGMCNTNADCGPNQICNPHQCFNPYAPCYGECQNAPTGGFEGDTCTTNTQCRDGLLCKGIVNGTGTCRPETWCTSETVDVDCAALPHIQIPGNWACVDSACAWHPNSIPPMSVAGTENVAIPDNNSAGASSVAVVESAFCARSEVVVNFVIRHTYIGDLVVDLVDPSGAVLNLHNRTGGGTDDLAVSRTAYVSHTTGIGGQWRLFVRDLAAHDTGYIESFGLTFICR